MNLSHELFLDLISVASGMPLVVKAGWPVFMMWCAAQIVWFRRARAVPAAPAAAAKPAPAVRKLKSSSSVRPAAPATRTGGSPEFLAALGLDADERSTPHRLADPPASGSVYR